MASFPIVYPKENGPGRLLELCSFRRSGISDERYKVVFNGINAITSKFPISRQFLSGRKLDQSDITVMIADWTSAEEKDIFEPGEQYQSIKPAFSELVNAEDAAFTCHHIVLTGPAVTPEAGVYVVHFYTVPSSKQQDFALKVNTHVASTFQKQGPLFFVAAPSRENADVVVSICGWPKMEDAQTYLQSEAFDQFQKATEDLSRGVDGYQAELRAWKPSN